MAKQDMSELGFGKESDVEASGEKVTERIDNQSWQVTWNWRECSNIGSPFAGVDCLDIRF